MAFKIGKHELLAEPMEVLKTLKYELEKQDIERFRIFKHTSNNIMTTCPFHENKSGEIGMERRPSFGISTEEQRMGDRVIPSGTCHCFTCGYNSSIDEFVSNLFGYNDHGFFGRKWLIKNFLTLEVEHRKPVNFMANRGRDQKIEKQRYVSEKKLESFRYTHPYMYKRGLTDEIIEMFDVGYQEDYKVNDTKRIEVITFPVRDVKGRTIFISRRSVKGKFFKLPTGSVKPLYGIYELMKYGSKTKRVIIVESQINALTCWVRGDQSVALFGTGDEEQTRMILSLPHREICIALDPDKAGYAGTQRLFKALRGKKIVTRMILPPGKDINN